MQVVTTQGMTSAARERVRLGVKRGELTRVTQGVYLRTHEIRGLAPWERFRALTEAVAVHSPSLVAAGRSAAVCLGVPFHDYDSQPVFYASSRRTNRSFSIRSWGREMKTHAIRTKYFDGQIVVTGYADTCVDLARWEGTRAGVVAMDWALKERKVSREALGSIIAGNTQRGIANVREAERLAIDVSESPQESVLRLQLLELGLGPVLVQPSVYYKGKFIARPDFLFADHLIAVEYDGQWKFRIDESLLGIGLPDERVNPAARELKRMFRASIAGLDFVRIDNYALRADLWQEALRSKASSGKRTPPAGLKIVGGTYVE